MYVRDEVPNFQKKNFFFEVGQLLFLKIALLGLRADIYISAAQKWVSMPL